MPGYEDIAAGMEQPSLPAPLLYQLLARIRGQQAQPWSGMDYAMGLGTGPRIGVPGALQKALGGGFRKLRRGLSRQKTAKALQGRNPEGRPDVPSWEAMASTEAPSGRTRFGEIE